MHIGNIVSIETVVPVEIPTPDLVGVGADVALDPAEQAAMAMAH